MNRLLILLGRLISFFSKKLNLGSGSTWPGHLALTIRKNFIKDISSQNKNLKIILIAGTNGKTTTGKFIQTILEKNGKKVFQNHAGANLQNGVASSLLLHANGNGTIPYDFAVFEVDENILPIILDEIIPKAVVLLNLFRDQLDRYGEIDTITHKWKQALKKLSKNTFLILNADDPQIAFLAKDLALETLYFGLNDSSSSQESYQHAADSSYCPRCGTKLRFERVYFSHLGVYHCGSCQYKRPTPILTRLSHYPLPGIYNRYNTLASVLVAKSLGIPKKTIESALQKVSPAFGRQEIVQYKGKKIQLFLSKNPTSFNESLRTIKMLSGRHVVFVLNDRIPDGRDVSWIWDVDFENLANTFSTITVSGDRVFDLALRIKYAGLYEKLHYFENLSFAIEKAMEKLQKEDLLFVLPTYSAMLDVRKIITGKKLL